MTAPSQMFTEAAQAPARVAAQLASNRELMADAVARLETLDPPFAITIARGSSDHAAAFAKHLFETRLGLPTLSQSPSVATLYRATSEKLRGTLALAISQSGRSPDLIETAIAAREKGALLIAMVNDAYSPLAREADILVPLHAGEERSVAATKSYVASLVAVADLAARWGRDAALAAALDAIEPALDDAWAADWGAMVDALATTQRLLVLGRGSTAPIAAEAALKFKEVAQIHAEAFSSAEVAHGPMALVREGDPVFAFAPQDAAAAGFTDRLDALAQRGARIIGAGVADAAVALPVARTADPAIDAIGMALSFYRAAEALARRRGLDPDDPPHLSKVTRTR
ncbi:SIS domain-containing protein [Qipengyuania sp. JC766]|uniref:SIS domain-containing protein n=1 Tax=Qipengyuania sp. JC766 TaxID=3232139 RepID=UPI0034573DF0